MKTVYKKAISLANKNGQNFIKEMAAYYTYIGIEEGNISNWFVLIAKSKETGKYICLSISLIEIVKTENCYRVFVDGWVDDTVLTEEELLRELENPTF